jgi:hypothetical protein
MARRSALADPADVAYEDKPIPGFVRVDLMPQRVLSGRAARRAKLVAICLILFALLVVLAARLYLQVQIQEAEDELLLAEAAGAGPRAELVQYSEVGPVFAAAEQGQEALTVAMGDEVRWSFLLNQLSFATPAGVELAGVGGEIAPSGPVPASPGGALPPQPSVGSMTFTGTADSYGAVAEWVNSLEGLKDYTYPFLSNSAKERTRDGTATGKVTWDAEASLSPNALSGRYGEALPAQPAPAPADPGAAPQQSTPVPPDQTGPLPADPVDSSQPNPMAPLLEGPQAPLVADPGAAP